MLQTEAQLGKRKGNMNCDWSILPNKTDSITVSLKTSYYFSKLWGKQRRIFSKNIVFVQDQLLAKDQIIKSLLERQTAILDNLAEQKHEWNNQQQAVSLRESSESSPTDFLQQQ